MIDTQSGLFTVAVFQDVAWAAKALDALKQAGFSHDGTTILAKATDAAAALIEKTFGRPGDRMELGAIARRWRTGRSSPRCRDPAAICRRSASRARCAVSAFRRTTAGSSKR